MVRAISCLSGGPSTPLLQPADPHFSRALRPRGFQFCCQTMEKPAVTAVKSLLLSRAVNKNKDTPLLTFDQHLFSAYWV